MVSYVRHRLMKILLLLIYVADATPHFNNGNENNHGKHHYKREEFDFSSSYKVQKEKKRERNTNESPKKHLEKRIKSKKVTIVKYPTMNTNTSSNRTQSIDFRNIINRCVAESSNSTICKNEKSDIIEGISTQSTKEKQRPKRQSNSSIKQSGGKDGASLRRIKREWKDAVKLGIAYDWQKGETVTTRGRSASGKSMHGDVKENLKYDYIRIGPWGKSLLRWHFSVKGPSCSVYSMGVYHGRILLPKDYPLSPPRIQMLTPSGRFISGEDICLSASAFHPETWTPRWTILSLVDALRIHMLTTANEIGGVDASSKRRRQLALESRHWKTEYVDHGKMIKDGLFHDEDYDDESITQEYVTQKRNDPAPSNELKINSFSKQPQILRIMVVVGRIIIFILKHPIQVLLLSAILYLMYTS